MKQVLLAGFLLASLFVGVEGQGLAPTPAGLKGSGGSTLNTSITAFWQLGSTADSVGANTLTNNGSVSFANDGPNGGGIKCATFSGANYLSIADNAALSNNTDTTIAGWFYLANITTGSERLVSKWETTNEYRVYKENSNLKSDVSPASDDASAGMGGITVNTWHSFIMVYIAGAQTVQIWIDNSTTNGTAATHGTLSDGTSAFALGADDAGATFMTGRLYGVGFWKQAFSGAERTEFHNSGTAKLYPF